MDHFIYFVFPQAGFSVHSSSEKESITRRIWLNGFLSNEEMNPRFREYSVEFVILCLGNIKDDPIFFDGLEVNRDEKSQIKFVDYDSTSKSILGKIYLPTKTFNEVKDLVLSLNESKRLSLSIFVKDIPDNETTFNSLDEFLKILEESGDWCEIGSVDFSLSGGQIVDRL